MLNFVHTIENLITRCVPQWLASLVLRIGVAIPFWKSGLTKWDGFGVLSETPVVLFENEFMLHILGKEYSFPFPTFMAYASSVGEIILPILVVFGLFTRFAGLGLLLMTFIIQLTFPDAWPLHLTWAAMAIGVIHLGGSRLSLDQLLPKPLPL
jgi:putative oxidoreductase